MMGHKICFCEEIWIIIPKLTLLLLLIWSTDNISFYAEIWQIVHVTFSYLSTGNCHFFLKFKVFNIPSVAQNCSIKPQQDVVMVTLCFVMNFSISFFFFGF